MNLILLENLELEILDLNGLKEYNFQLIKEVENLERDYQFYKTFQPFQIDCFPINEKYPLTYKLRNLDNMIFNKIAKYKLLSLSKKKLKLEKYIEKYEEYLKNKNFF
jgi:hypothetical protein